MFNGQVVPYKECKQGLEPQEFSETILTPKKFVEKECIQNKKEIPHKKLLPECRNVTKQNCVTNWETDSYGNQVKYFCQGLLATNRILFALPPTCANVYSQLLIHQFPTAP